MIDWLTVAIPYDHHQPINGGCVVSIDPEGATEWLTEKSFKVQGSYEASLQIRSEQQMTADYYWSISLSGNFVKFLQGHNVWGTSKLFDLTVSAFVKAFEQIGFQYELEKLVKAVYQGFVKRIDVTENYDLGCDVAAEQFLYALERSANLRHRGSGALDKRGTTLYFGKHSRRWALKVYLKYRELLAHKPSFAGCPTGSGKVTNYALGLVRFELVFRAKELEKLGLSRVCYWNNEKSESLYNRYLSKLNCSDNMKTSDHLPSLEGLPARLIAVVNLWYEGHDLRAMYPRASFYRYKSEIKKLLNIDISIAPPMGMKENDQARNVVPLVRVLEAKPKPLPEWAYDAEFYFDPPAYYDWATGRGRKP